MGPYENELRLAYAVAINAVVLVSAWRFVARRVGGGVAARIVDVGLLYYLVQYVTVAGLGLVGLLSPVGLGVVAAVVALSWWVAADRTGAPAPKTSRSAGTPGPRHEGMSSAPAHPPPRDEEGADESRLDAAVFLACSLFLLGYIGGIVHHQRFLPPMANDPLTYHLPAAVQWLQTGRLGLHETWFFNPANTYSPLAGSTFIAWLIAPTGNALLARFVQVGPLLMTFVALAHVGRLLGVRLGVAAVIALGAVLSRPFITQVALAKDDLFAAAFFIAAVAALSPPRVCERWAAARVGIALGLFLAVKYTALLSLPLLLLMADAPLRARWRPRQWVVAIGTAALIAGPWYVRNLLQTGNPLFPTEVRLFGVTLLDGLFTLRRSEQMRGAGTWAAFTAGYYGLTVPVALWLIGGWIASVVRRGRQASGDPLVRVAIVGPVVGVALFVLMSPYAETRFTYPSMLLLFACIAAALATLPALPARAGVPIGYAVAVAVALTAVATSYVRHRLSDVLTFSVVGLIVAVVGMVAVRLIPRIPRGLPRLSAGLAAGLAVALFTYVHWPSYVSQTREVTTMDAPPLGRAWELRYGEIAAAWDYVRRQIPPGETLAYANTYLVYPLQGYDHDRPVVYAPVSPGVATIADLPRFPEPIAGERILEQIDDLTTAGADAETWLANLAASGATHLFVAKRDIAAHDKPASPPPPEIAFARARPEQFFPVFGNDAAVVYRIDVDD